MCNTVSRTMAEKQSGRLSPQERMLWHVKSGPLTRLPRTHLLTACSQQCYMATKGTIKPIPNDNPPLTCLHTNVFTAVHNVTAYRWKRTWPPDIVQVLVCLRRGGKTFSEVGSPPLPILAACLVLSWKFSFPDL